MAADRAGLCPHQGQAADQASLLRRLRPGATLAENRLLARPCALADQIRSPQRWYRLPLQGPRSVGVLWRRVARDHAERTCLQYRRADGAGLPEHVRPRRAVARAAPAGSRFPFRLALAAGLTRNL